MKKNDYDILSITGGVTAPVGFVASGVASGIKKDASPDIAVVFSKEHCTAAGIFTLNRVKGHSLAYCIENIQNGKAQCVFINSGNANACIGDQGKIDADLIAKACATELEIDKSDVLTASTGVIGFPLPMEKVLSGIKAACSGLSSDGGSDAAKAIMTTDTFSKELAVETVISGKKVTIGGMAKGSGMIHPNMATMIAVITTDASIKPALLKKLLSEIADISFNRISIDGDTSVCDSVLILANGVSECVIDENDFFLLSKFKKALCILFIGLAKMIVKDGEGATKLIEINILNAIDKNSAKAAAKAIANSPLVKTAFYGEDANWGRILTAAGYSGAVFDPLQTTIKIGSLTMYENGVAIRFDESTALEILKEDEIIVTVDFGEGEFHDTVWTCDMSHKYIDINANYRT